MLLVIPSMDIRDRRCCRAVQGIPGSGRVYSDDPVETARLWRQENSKCLHVVDLDRTAQGRLKNVDTIRQIVQSVDIPIQLGDQLEDLEDIETALAQLGVYRVVVSGLAQLDLIRRLIDEHGSRKIAIGIIAKDGTVEAAGKKGRARGPAECLASY